MKNLLRRCARDDSGSTAIEYGLIAALISVIIIVSVKAIGTKLSAAFEKVQGNL